MLEGILLGLQTAFSVQNLLLVVAGCLALGSGAFLASSLVIA